MQLTEGQLRRTIGIHPTTAEEIVTLKVTKSSGLVILCSPCLPCVRTDTADRHFFFSPAHLSFFVDLFSVLLPSCCARAYPSIPNPYVVTIFHLMIVEINPNFSCVAGAEEGRMLRLEASMKSRRLDAERRQQRDAFSPDHPALPSFALLRPRGRACPDHAPAGCGRGLACAHGHLPSLFNLSRSVFYRLLFVDAHLPLIAVFPPLPLFLSIQRVLRFFL